MNTDKQQQTCYVYANMNDWDKRFSVIGNEIMGCEHVEKFDSVYIHTPEELAKAFREVAGKAWDAGHNSFNNIPKKTYLNQHYPLPNQ